MKQLWVTPLAQWSPSHIQIHLCKCWQQAIHLSAFLCCFFFFFFLNVFFTSTYLTLLLPHAGAHASHAGSGSAGPGDQHGELAEPPLPPSLWQELRIPRLMMVKTEVTTSLHFHCKTPNAPWMQPSARKKNPHNLNLILSFSEWHRHLEWQTAYQFTADHTSLHF